MEIEPEVTLDTANLHNTMAKNFETPNPWLYITCIDRASAYFN